MSEPIYPDLSLSVVLPGYNEEAIIEDTVLRSLASLRKIAGTFELIVVNDASRDRTAELAERLARENPEIVLVHNDTNLRQGGSLLKAFQLARYEWVTHNGMDYPFDFDDLPLLLEHRHEADVLVASRQSYPGTTLLRRWASECHRGLIREAFGVPIRDWGFIQIYRRSVLESQQVFSRATAFAMPERIIRAHRAGFRIKEVSIEFHRRLTGVSSSASRRNIEAALIDMTRLWLEFRQVENGQK